MIDDDASRAITPRFLSQYVSFEVGKPWLAAVVVLRTLRDVLTFQGVAQERSLMAKYQMSFKPLERGGDTHSRGDREKADGTPFSTDKTVAERKKRLPLWV